jgi:hypothetical protein
MMYTGLPRGRFPGDHTNGPWVGGTVETPRLCHPHRR